METSIEFFLYLVAMARILVVFLRIHRKSRRKRQAKACVRSGQPVVYRTLAKTSDEWLSRIHFIFLQLDRHFSRVSDYARQFPEGGWSFLGPGDKKSGVGPSTTNQMENETQPQKWMTLKFAATGHPVFWGTSSLSRGTLKSKGGGNMSIHYNAEPQTAELLLRTIIAVNQIIMYGAVATWCNNQTPPSVQ